MAVPPVPELDPMDQRILGALLEKQVTVPASYPMTLNALRTACNQSSSREPVTHYGDRELEERLRDLKQRDLVRVVWAGRGSRTLKYHQLLEEHLAPTEAERALLTVLLLRGPQSAGELRTRTERLHSFADRDAVEQTLAGLAARPEPWVRELERRRGQQDPRWVHLLGPQPAPASAPEEPDVDREGVLAEGSDSRDARVRSAYEAVAATYAEQTADALDELPFDRWLLGRVAAGVEGPVLEVGCGPGHVAAHLAEYTFSPVRGIDLSPAMVEEARRRHPDVEVEVGDLRRPLRPRDAPAWAAVVAWDALLHLAGSELPEAVAGLARVVAPGGRVALALPVGHEVRHVARWHGHEVDLDVVFHDRAQVLAAVSAAGLVDVEWYLRGAQPGDAAADGSGNGDGNGDGDGDGDGDGRLYILARTPG